MALFRFRASTAFTISANLQQRRQPQFETCKMKRKLSQNRGEKRSIYIASSLVAFALASVPTLVASLAMPASCNKESRKGKILRKQHSNEGSTQKAPTLAAASSASLIVSSDSRRVFFAFASFVAISPSVDAIVAKSFCLSCSSSAWTGKR